MQEQHPVIYPRFNKLFFKDFWALVRPYWVSDDKYKAFLYLFINLICSFAGVYSSVALNSVTKVMFDALSSFQRPLLIASIIKFLGIAVLIFFCAGYGSYFSGLLSIRWQKWLTQNTLADWLKDHKHYRLNGLKNKVDNPDQRITEDLGALPSLSLKISFLLLNSISTYLSFSVILWGLSSHFPLMLGSLQLEVPGYLFFSATLYGILGLWLMGVIGKKLSAFEYRQQLFTADFRARLLRIREYGEQISLYQGEKVEAKQLDNLFSRIFDNFLKANHLRKNLMFFGIGFEILTQVVGLFLAMPLFLAKKVQYGGMMQITGAFVSVVRAFSNMMDAYGSLAELKAVVYRLTEFQNALKIAEQYRQDGIQHHMHEQNFIEVRQLHIEHFNGQAMINIPKMHFQAPYRYLITGASGIGKSTFFKTLLGLWPHATGEISMPFREKIFLLPQRSYLPDGTLREVLCYPQAPYIDDQSIKFWLDRVGLDAFKGRLDEENRWSQICSLGQQQLMGFVRLFLSQAPMLLLDEATSALDEATQAKMYQLIDEYFPDSCVISIGHRMSLKDFHQYQCRMDMQEQFEIERL